MFQLRAEDEKGIDTGAIEDCATLEQAFEKFVAGGYWKLSWTSSTGKRIRLLREGEKMIRITDMDDEINTELKAEALLPIEPGGRRQRLLNEMQEDQQ